MLIDLTTNHQGWFIVKLCPVNKPDEIVTQTCLDSHVLPVAETNSPRYYIPKGTPKSSLVEYKVTLPEGLTCEQCVIQWTWTSGLFLHFIVLHIYLLISRSGTYWFYLFSVMLKIAYRQYMGNVQKWNWSYGMWWPGKFPKLRRCANLQRSCWISTKCYWYSQCYLFKGQNCSHWTQTIDCQVRERNASFSYKAPVTQ